MTTPTPRQVGHGRDVIIWPSSERCTVCTSPRPPQVSHGYRRGIAVGALALAAVAQHRGVDGDLFGHAGRALFEVEPHPQQRVRARPDPADRAARRRTSAEAAAEEGLEYIAQAAETAEPAGRRGGVFQRIPAQVDDAALLRVAQHFVGDADFLEFRLRGLIGVDVGMQFARQLAVRAFDLRIAGVSAHAEQPVVVACHA